MTNRQAQARLDEMKLDRHWLSEATGYSINSLYNVFAGAERQLNDRMNKAFTRAFDEEARRREVDLSKPGSSIWDLVYFSGKELEQIDRAKKLGGYQELSPFYRDAVISFADDLLRKEAREAEAGNVVALPARANIQAAAGPPIAAEVTDWDAGNDTISVKINGLSMDPKFSDGEVIAMKLKGASRNPWMKKGLIYLVEYDGGYTVKRYNRRAAKPEEIGEDWVEDGKVRVLESINPDFPEIIIKQPLEWVAWYNEE